ncbi:MAG: hypothetical protein ABI970_06785, partial [Chloroflexota bacterium]
MQSRQLIQSALFMLLLCFLVFLFDISTQPNDLITFGDNVWYLNRAHLIWQGVLPDLFVYTLSYPAVVGLIDFVTKDVILAGMIVNALLLWCILLGVYILGYWLYARPRIAWLAVLLVVFNASILDAQTFFSGTIPFVAANVWILVACVFVVRR